MTTESAGPLDRNPAAGPLAGVRIVEFDGIGPGPFAAMLLADMGADIVRIDRPSYDDLDAPQIVARGRRRVVADLKISDKRDEILSLLDRADALIEGFRPGVMERLGLGPEIVLRRNVKLVYGRMTGWGQTGPLSRTAGHDLNYIAITGALSAIGPPASSVPPLNLVGDYGGGALYLVAGLLAGIISAQRTGRGQVVDSAICDGAASMMATFCELSAQGRWTDERQSNLLDGGAPFYRTFECADGGQISIAALEPQFYAMLRERLDLTGPEFDRDDVDSWPQLHERLATLFRTRTREDWCSCLEGSDVCFAPVLSLTEAPLHPHLASRGTFIELDGIVQPGPAPRFSGTPSMARALQRRPLTSRELQDAWPVRKTNEELVRPAT